MQIHLRTPKFNYSQITDDLFISSSPNDKEQLEQLKKAGVKLIINTRGERHIKSNPIEVLWIPMLDAGIFPFPTRQLSKGVKRALEVIDDGGKVLVNCRMGRHRSVVMAACILMAQGYSAKKAQKLIQKGRPAADFTPARMTRAMERFAKSLKTKK